MTDASTARRDERRPGAALRAAGVSRSFEGVQALQGVTLELHRHEVVGLIGPNGAGQVDARERPHRLRLPDDGTVELEGRDVTRWSAAPARARRARADVPAQPLVPRASRVRENVEVAALGVGAGPREARRRADELLELLGLERVRGRSRRARSRTATSGGSASRGRSRPSRASC